MASYDGKIRIDTEIDGSNAEKDIKRLTQTLKRAGGALAAAFSLKLIYEWGKVASDAAIGVESSMLRVKEIFGSAAKDIDQFAKQNADSLGMSKKTAYEYAAVYGNLFSMIASDSEQNAQLTEKFLTGTAVVASKTGRTLEDVSERFRSGVLGNTEAIEDLGINVNVAMLEMTDSFKKIADGRSWEKLTFYEQQQIRIMGILEQVQKKYGDSVQQSAAFTRQKFSAAMQNLQVTIGNVINVAIIPLMEMFTRLAVFANTVIAALFGKAAETQVDLGNSGNKAAAGQNSLANATNKANKAAKNSLATFDELNVLQKEVSQSEGLAGIPGIGGIKSKTSLKDIGGQIEFEIPKGLEKWKTAIGSAEKSVKSIGETIQVVWEMGGVKEFVSESAESFNSTSVNIFDGALKALDGTLQLLGGSLVFTKGQFTANREEAQKGYDLMDTGMQNLIYGMIDMILGEDLRKAWGDYFNLVGKDFEKWWVNDVEPWFGAEKWGALWLNTKKGFAVGWQQTVNWWNSSGIPKWWNDSVAPWFTVAKWTTLWTNTKTAFKAGWADIVTWWNKSGAAAWWTNNVTPWFTVDKWANLLVNVQKAFTETFSNIGKSIKESIKGSMNAAIDALNLGIEGINKMDIAIPEWIPVVGGKTFDMNIPKIPKLAKGAVIPPNAPFMAMLGDQRSGINIETPLETMLQAFRTAMQESGGKQTDATIILEVDGMTFGKAVIKHANGYQRSVGRTLLEV